MDQRSQIAILGFGEEGRAVLDFLIGRGYSHVTVCDINVDLEEEMPEGVSVRLGPKYLEDLTDFEVIFRSPGVRFMEPAVQNAVASGVEVTSSTAYFMDQCVCPVVGVSGTKGKGTTASLVYEMVKDDWEGEVYLAGNIGVPAIGLLNKVKGGDLVILEMSSFQLQDMKKSPKYAILLNTTSEHLDYHEDDEEYLAAKESILAHQDENDLAILNQDYKYVDYYKGLAGGRVKFVSLEGEADGCVKDGAVLVGGEEVCKVDDVALIGSHNLENVLPACVLAVELGVDEERIAEVVREFKGLEHRLEPVGEKDGVRFFNDSFSTVPETSMAAVDSFDEETVLIAGGSDKGADYGEWALKILTRPSLRAVVLMGATAEKMERALEEARAKLGEAEGSETDVLKADDLSEAVEKAVEKIGEFDGGVVVMSPASASFDQFKNYKHRGESFKKIINQHING